MRYIVGKKVGNLVLWRRASRDVKRDFRMYIWRYTSPNENFEYGYPHSNALLLSLLKLELCKPHEAARHPTKCDVINNAKLFPIVYHRIYCRKFLTLTNQTSRYKSKCIRIDLIRQSSVIKFFVLSIFEWPLKTGSTVYQLLLTWDQILQHLLVKLQEASLRIIFNRWKHLLFYDFLSIDMFWVLKRT